MEFIDLSVISFFIPLLSFLIVFLLTFALFAKAKLFDHKGWQIFLSLLISTIFVSAIGPVKFVSVIVPWFAVFVVSLLLILSMIGFIGADKFAGLNKTIITVFVVGLLAVFILSGAAVFSSYTVGLRGIWEWISSPRIFGAIALLAVSGAVSWYLAKE